MRASISPITLGNVLSVRKYRFYLSANAASGFGLEHQAADLSTCQILLKKTSMMQFCSTRQFISCSQTLVPLQLPAAVLPADAAPPLTSTFSKVMEPAAAPTWLPSLEEQDRLNNRAPAARPGTPTDSTFDHHDQQRRANTVRSGRRCSGLTREGRCSRCLWCSGTVSQRPAGEGGG